MPHAVFQTGTQLSATQVLPRQMIPGIEPGGSRVGEPLKPALLINDLWAEIEAIDMGAGADLKTARMGLKLSQDNDLTPGLILPVFAYQNDLGGAIGEGRDMQELGHHHIGTVWVPAYVGINVTASGNLTDFQASIHLDYDVIDVPFWDWFVMWDFLDNITDDSTEY